MTTAMMTVTHSHGVFSPRARDQESQSHASLPRRRCLQRLTLLLSYTLSMTTLSLRRGSWKGTPTKLASQPKRRSWKRYRRERASSGGQRTVHLLLLMRTRPTIRPHATCVAESLSLVRRGYAASRVETLTFALHAVLTCTAAHTHLVTCSMLSASFHLLQLLWMMSKAAWAASQGAVGPRQRISFCSMPSRVRAWTGLRLDCSLAHQPVNAPDDSTASWRQMCLAILYHLDPFLREREGTSGHATIRLCQANSAPPCSSKSKPVLLSD
mmetsp:Transcript_18079/g.48633  ORF Transcript_18079/g.48633 Transcript_18079/m.48633 type:complete len:269 (-) Transcript_18079:756-1562(-)